VDLNEDTIVSEVHTDAMSSSALKMKAVRITLQHRIPTSKNEFVGYSDVNFAYAREARTVCGE
jgi:hypothetical protein